MPQPGDARQARFVVGFSTRSSRNPRATSLVLDPFLEFSDLQFRQDGSARPVAIVVDLLEFGKCPESFFLPTGNQTLSRSDVDRGARRSHPLWGGGNSGEEG
jgi:hypothetical protein